MRITRTRVLLSLALSILLLSISGGAVAQSPYDPLPAEEGDSGVELSVELSANAPLLLPYQGRLTVPGTGQPVLDGDYSMTFSLYNVESGGSALWTETKTVSVAGGLFTTNVGDATALNQNQLNGQGLWLGIKVGADAEAAPRIPVLPVVYAMALVPGSYMKAPVTGSMVSVTNMGTTSGSNGVFGMTSSTTSGASGVRGVGGGSTGLTPSNVVGVTGESAAGYGVFGMSNTGLGVYGYSQGSYGVYGAGMGAQPGAFGGNWGSGYGGYFYSSSGNAVYASGSITATGNIKANGTVSGAYTSLPVAYGHISSAGSKYSGSSNVSSSWNGSYYVITISGHSYGYSSYVTVVTADGACSSVPTTDSLSNNLLVRFSGGAQCSFQFVTYKP